VIIIDLDAKVHIISKTTKKYPVFLGLMLMFGN